MNLTKEEFEAAVKKQFEGWDKNEPQRLYGGAFDRLHAEKDIHVYVRENDITIEHNWQTGEIRISGPAEAVEKIRDIIYKAPPEA